MSCSLIPWLGILRFRLMYPNGVIVQGRALVARSRGGAVRSRPKGIDGSANRRAGRPD